MARAVALLVLVATTMADAHAAAPPSLEPDAGHEVVAVPRSPIPLRGPRFAPVTVEIHLAIGITMAGRAAEMVRRATSRASDVRVLYLLSASHPAAELAAEALLEADHQGRFVPFLDKLLAEVGASYPQPELLRIGREVGLDTDRLADALATRPHRPVLERMMADLRADGRMAGEVRVNGRRVAGPIGDEAAFTTALRDGRDRAARHLEAGVPLGKLYESLVDEEQSLLRAQAGRRPPTRRVAVDDTRGPSRGAPLAPVTLVLFCNFAGTSCADAGQLVRRLLDRFPTELRVVVRQWVPGYGPPLETHAARLAELAALRGRFWAMWDRWLVETAISRRPPAGVLDALALRAGVDPADLDRGPQALRQQIADELQRDLADCRRLGLNYTPGLAVNGVLLSGVPPLGDVDALIRAELERGLADRILNRPSPTAP
jgi:protein-disulfide isomerase